MGIRITEGTAGKPLIGTVTGQVISWNNATQKWEVGASAYAKPGLVYWDAATLVPLALQDGSYDYPYANLQTAVNAAGATDGVVICLGHGDAAQSFTFDGQGVNNTLNIVAYQGNDSRNPVKINTATLQNHCHVIAQGIQFSAIVGINSRLWADYCGAGTAQMQAGNFRWRNYQAATPSDTSTPWAVGNIDCTSGGTFAAFGMKIAGNVQIGGAQATTENCIQQCDMSGGPGYSIYAANAGTRLYIDHFSLARARAQNYNIQGVNNTGTTTKLDLPATAGVVFAVGALANAFTDVAVALPGCRPGDTFEITMTARLANVGIVGAWCAANDIITVRFYGNTAGGNVTCTINTIANSGN